MHSLWYWLAAGLLPYALERHYINHTNNDKRDAHAEHTEHTERDRDNEQHISVRALFWRMTLHKQQGHWSGTIYIPFIEHLRS